MNSIKLSYRTTSRHGYSVKFSPYYSNRIACATSQNYGIAGCGTVYILDVCTSQLRLVQQFDWNDGLFDVTWAENNENIFITAGGDGSIQIWDLGQTKGPLKVWQEHTKEVNAVEWCQTRNENFVLSGSWDKLIKLWDINASKSIGTFPGHDHIVYHVSWAPLKSACFASASGDHSLRIWDTRQTSQVLAIAAHSGEILTCDWCKYNQNMIFSGGADGLVKGWDLRNLHIPLFQLSAHKYAVRRIK
ncbi:peroxisomal targeting signal 2 receptor-like, partial [Physella acuta]|uniref:peroxisomal targeting signal 2 receptor-like n=1 Tax=Physella acuta TaxID=109671 RepID=UPI0027DCEBD9